MVILMLYVLTQWLSIFIAPVGKQSVSFVSCFSCSGPPHTLISTHFHFWQPAPSCSIPSIGRCQFSLHPEAPAGQVWCVDQFCHCHLCNFLPVWLYSYFALMWHFWLSQHRRSLIKHKYITRAESHAVSDILPNLLESQNKKWTLLIFMDWFHLYELLEIYLRNKQYCTLYFIRNKSLYSK